MKKLLSLLLAMGLATSLAGCGTTATASSASSTEPTAASSTAEATAESTEAAADSDLAYIQGKGKMVIGYTVYEPMNYTDAQGNFAGFDTELARAVCKELGVEAEFVEINWDTKEVELSGKSIDCIWNGLTITKDREDTMAMTKPYVQNAQVVVMKADAAYTDTASLVGKTVVAEMGSAGEETVQGDENLAQAEYIAKGVQTDCLMEVKAGTADAAVLDLTLANAMIGEGTDYADLAIKDRLSVEEYGVAFRQGSDTRDAVNAAFTTLAADGTMATLAEKYGLDLAE
ncbi:MAG: transporter substrate-binding domain-containing protein [Gemmiger sp.]|nr:transporter substrate-binding domain-containing protein [Gemmiger sp.]